MGNGALAIGPKLPRPSSTLPAADQWRRLGWSNSSIRVTDPLIRIIALSEHDRAALSGVLNQFLPVAQLFSTRRAPDERHNEVAHQSFSAAGTLINDKKTLRRS